MIQLSILTPEQTIYEGVIKKAIMPGVLGNFQILQDHAPIVSTLTKGELSYIDTSNEEHILAITHGMVEVKGNKITVLIF